METHLSILTRSLLVPSGALLCVGSATYLGGDQGNSYFTRVFISFRSAVPLEFPESFVFPEHAYRPILFLTIAALSPSKPVEASLDFVRRLGGLHCSDRIRRVYHDHRHRDSTRQLLVLSLRP